MRICLLGSGSLGNVAFIEGQTTRVLIDAGLNKSAICERLGQMSAGMTLAQLTAVLVTHNHGDHVGCAHKLDLPIYATAGTIRTCELEAKAKKALHTVNAGEAFTVGDLQVTPVPLPHDAVDTVGYVVSDGINKVGVLTDCGYDAEEVAAAYAGCDVLVLETNHDATLIKYGPYPPSLKRRVAGRRGHLSNDQSASLLRMILAKGPAPRLVIAAHLSLTNNRPQLAKSALQRVLGRSGRVLIATQTALSPMIEITGGRLRVEQANSRQLQFDFITTTTIGREQMPS